VKTIVNDCPRCRAQRMTFDVLSDNFLIEQHGWMRSYEIFSLCRNCKRTTIFVIKNSSNSDYRYMNANFSTYKGDLTQYFTCDGYISLKDRDEVAPPEHLPEDIEGAFREGARCIAVGCWNAAGTMFRMALDLATRPLLPDDGTAGINRRQRRDLGMRLPWLFEHKKIPEALKELSSCIHQDGNDGAHQGNLTKEDAEDLLEFSDALLSRLYTEPARLRLAAQRRALRRGEG